MAGRSYYSSRREPDCFGDSNEYSETSSHCRACPYSADCAEAIQESINTVALRNARSVVTPRKYNSYTTSSSTSSTTRPTNGGNAIIKPVKFNHNRPLVGQYITYVGYDVAEAMATRAVDLVRSCRNEYERELFRGENEDK